MSKSDLEQAKRELTGEPDIDPKEAELESVPESERWDSVPGSIGHKVPVSPSADEDDEAEAATKDWLKRASRKLSTIKMLEAARLAKKRDL